MGRSRTGSRGRPRLQSKSKKKLAKGKKTNKVGRPKSKKSPTKKATSKKATSKRSSKKAGPKRASKKKSTTASPQKAKKTKKIVYGPSKPKRPESAFLLYLRDFRKSHGDMGMLDQTRQGGREWKTLSPELKQPYEVQHSKLKEAYQAKKEDYNKKKKPKRAPSAFFIFSAEKRPAAEFASLSITDKAKRIGEIWRGLDDQARQPYYAKQKNLQGDYRQALAAWNRQWGVPQKAIVSL